MSHLVSALPVEEFWRFGSWSRQQLKNILFEITAEARRRGEPAVEAASDLQITTRLMRDRESRGEVQITGLSDVKDLYRSTLAKGLELAIRSIAPSTAHAEEYQAAVLRHVLWLRNPGESPEPPSPRHNEVSAALVVQFGRTRLVLGGDLESKAWENVVTRTEKLKLDLAAHFVKVSHHGSTNGYCPGLWERFARNGHEPVAVITLYRNQGLPRLEAVDHISRHTQRVLVTNRRPLLFGSNRPADLRFWKDWEFGAQLAARAIFHSFIADEPEDFGVCSVEFNHKGDALAVSCDGAADTLTLDPRAPA